jgi:hypothetical protein
MSIGKVSRVLNIINKSIESKNTKIKTPISLHEYTITPLKGKDEQELKQVINPRKPESKISEKLYFTIYNHILEGKNVNEENEDNILTFERFLKSESIFDVITLFHALNIATFEYMKDYEFVCPYCEATNKIDKIPYNNFTNESKTWDKDKPFTDYIFTVEIDLDENTKIIFNTKIATLYHEIAISKKILNETPINERSNLPLYTLTSSNIERCLFITNTIEVIENNDEENKTVLDNIYDIKMVLEALPENVIEEALDKFNEEFTKYIPNYVYKIKCSECEKESDVFYHPIFEFITRVLM